MIIDLFSSLVRSVDEAELKREQEVLEWIKEDPEAVARHIVRMEERLMVQSISPGMAGG